MATIYRYEFIDKEEDFNPGPYNISSRLLPRRTESVLVDGSWTRDDTPYGKLHTKMISKHRDDKHICVRHDVEGFEYNKHFCACDSLEGLKQWFRGFNTGLLKLGFKLVEYEVSELIYGRSRLQVVFKTEHVISRKVLK